jgi:hypothetical protein
VSVVAGVACLDAVQLHRGTLVNLEKNVIPEDRLGACAFLLCSFLSHGSKTRYEAG